MDWDLFRKIRDTDELQYDTLSELFAQIRKDVEKAYKEIPAELKVPGMDARLVHLLKAKQSLLKRWKRQRLNHRLKKKVAELDRSIEKHCAELNRQQWSEDCSATDGRMRTGSKWTLLKHLLDDGQAKGNQRLIE